MLMLVQVTYLLSRQSLSTTDWISVLLVTMVPVVRALAVALLASSCVAFGIPEIVKPGAQQISLELGTASAFNRVRPGYAGTVMAAVTSLNKCSLVACE